jgi:hypothetical protein
MNYTTKRRGLIYAKSRWLQVVHSTVTSPTWT